MSRAKGLDETRTEYTEYTEPVTLSEAEEEFFGTDGADEAAAAAEAAAAELSPEDQEIVARIEERKQRNRKLQLRRKRRTTVLMVLAFAVLLTMCSREIVRLKTENIVLQRRHAQLEQERDRLQKELENVGNKDYIKDQARKQLRLLDPGEKMFVFEDGKNKESTDAEEQEAAEAEEENKDEKEDSADE